MEPKASDVSFTEIVALNGATLEAHMVRICKEFRHPERETFEKLSATLEPPPGTLEYIAAFLVHEETSHDLVENVDGENVYWSFDPDELVEILAGHPASSPSVLHAVAQVTFEILDATDDIEGFIQGLLHKLFVHRNTGGETFSLILEKLWTAHTENIEGALTYIELALNDSRTPLSVLLEWEKKLAYEYDRVPLSSEERREYESSWLFKVRQIIANRRVSHGEAALPHPQLSLL